MASYKPQVKQENGTMVDLPLDAATINGGLTVLKSVPADAKFSDTTYGVVTTSTNGLMSTTMLTKLNGIAEGANKYTLPTAASDTLGGIKTGYTTSGKNYKVQVDSSGNAYVNVPWTDTNTTYGVATTSALGLVKSSTTGTTSGRDYVVQVNSDGTMKVNVPWTDSNTIYSAATSTTYGLVKIGYTTSGKNYAVQLDINGKMYVNVPWTDTNTHPDLSSYAKGAASSTDNAIARFDGTTGKIIQSSSATVNDDGDIAGRYIQGSWLQTTAATAQSTATKIAVIHSDNYIYYITPANLKTLLGVPTSDANTTYTLTKSGSTITLTGSDGRTTSVTDSNTTYGIANASTAGLVKPVSVITKPTINTASTTAGRYYHVQMSSDGNMFVNVPWSDTNTDTDTGFTSVSVTGSGNAVTSASSSGRALTLTKGATFLTSHQSIKTLNTNNASAQSVSSSEAIAGSGTINLHKVAKTGNYNDLLNKPTIPSVKTYYIHNLTFSGTNNNAQTGGFTVQIINTSETKFTYDTFLSYLSSNGFTSNTALYPAQGTINQAGFGGPTVGEYDNETNLNTHAAMNGLYVSSGVLYGVFTTWTWGYYSTISTGNRQYLSLGTNFTLNNDIVVTL